MASRSGRQHPRASRDTVPRRHRERWWADGRELGRRARAAWGAGAAITLPLHTLPFTGMNVADAVAVGQAGNIFATNTWCAHHGLGAA
jgi:hypothetical protein